TGAVDDVRRHRAPAAERAAAELAAGVVAHALDGAVVLADAHMAARHRDLVDAGGVDTRIHADALAREPIARAGLELATAGAARIRKAAEPLRLADAGDAAGHALAGGRTFVSALAGARPEQRDEPDDPPHTSSV